MKNLNLVASMEQFEQMFFECESIMSISCSISSANLKVNGFYQNE